MDKPETPGRQDNADLRVVVDATVVLLYKTTSLTYSRTLDTGPTTLST